MFYLESLSLKKYIFKEQFSIFLKWEHEIHYQPFFLFLINFDANMTSDFYSKALLTRLSPLGS